MNFPLWWCILGAYIGKSPWRSETCAGQRTAQYLVGVQANLLEGTIARGQFMWRRCMPLQSAASTSKKNGADFLQFLSKYHNLLPCLTWNSTMHLWNLAKDTYPDSLRANTGMTYRAVLSSRRRKLEACVISTTWLPIVTFDSTALEMLTPCYSRPYRQSPSCPSNGFQFELVRRLRTLILASRRPTRYVASRPRS